MVYCYIFKGMGMDQKEEDKEDDNDIFIPSEGEVQWVFSHRRMSRGRSLRDIPRD
jgi:hypothetical protein